MAERMTRAAERVEGRKGRRGGKKEEARSEEEQDSLWPWREKKHQRAEWVSISPLGRFSQSRTGWREC